LGAIEMKVLIQRVKESSVTIDNSMYSSIKKGIMALVGIEKGDTFEQVQKIAKKIVNLRIFPDENDKMNLSLIDINGEMLIVSQFTLCGDCKKGTRPSFDKSAPPDIANELYEKFIKEIETYGIHTQHGKFGAMMDVSLINDGPVTFMLEV
jgi:D-tyrosyl-tRNA(Tyr) deacylase